ncbi:MAG: hypothetical protein HYX21_00270 [Candidatus Yanofskybacteria bacterium]|nr:hypothetical protein [Candidatus Yanofskybacteria bacterium]
MKTKSKKSKQVQSKDSDFYFNDCGICQAMKRADEKGKNLSSEGLKEIFDKQNKKQNHKQK